MLFVLYEYPGAVVIYEGFNNARYADAFDAFGKRGPGQTKNATLASTSELKKDSNTM